MTAVGRHRKPNEGDELLGRIFVLTRDQMFSALNYIAGYDAKVCGHGLDYAETVFRP